MDFAGTGKIITRPATKDYHDGWERAFGKKDKKNERPNKSVSKKKPSKGK